MASSISYDHRLVDGATAARFLNDVIGYLEAPSRLLLALKETGIRGRFGNQAPYWFRQRWSVASLTSIIF
jgi:hypothetical protein